MKFPCKFDLEEDQLAEAGVVGGMKALLEWWGVEYVKDVAVADETIDSPTNDFSGAIMVENSRPEVIMAIGFQDSISNWGVIEGEPRAEDDAEAPDSEEAERMGG